MVKVNKNSEVLGNSEIINRISKELNKNKIINSLLLTHGLIEAYLLGIILYSGKKEIKDLNKKVLENIERIGFNNLLHINLISNNISFKLYLKILQFNKTRNTIVHDLISIDITNKKQKIKLKRA